MSDRVAKIVCPLVATVVTLALWTWVSKSGVVDELLVPSPADTLDSFFTLLNTYFFWDALWVTTQETLIGLVLGVGSAFVLGSLFAVYPGMRKAVFPTVVTVEFIPRIALAPLFLAWFGLGLAGKSAMAAAICFFPVLMNVVLGLESVNQNALSLLRSFGASRWEVYRKLLLPSAMPAVFASLKLAVTFALSGAIVAEFLGGQEGLGALVESFNYQLLIPQGFAIIAALSVMGMVLYGLVALVESRVLFWRGR